MLVVCLKIHSCKTIAIENGWNCMGQHKAAYMTMTMTNLLLCCQLCIQAHIGHIGHIGDEIASHLMWASADVVYCESMWPYVKVNSLVFVIKAMHDQDHTINLISMSLGISHLQTNK